MKQLIAMVGLPKSGKSTFVDRHFSNYQVICPDDIRLALGNQFDERTEPFVWAIHNTMLRAHMGRGYGICLDSTSTMAHRLEAYFGLSGAYGYDFKIFFVDTPVDICLSRNTGPGKMPEGVILRMATQLEELKKSQIFKLSEVCYVKNDDLH